MNASRHSLLDHLPVELLSSIASHLDLQDFRSFRLACRLISLRTRSLLACEEFNGLLWRPDAARLYQLSRIPECARRIRSVTFNFARLNEYKALHDSFSHHYLIEPELRSEILHDKWEQYFQTQRQKKALGGFRLDLAVEAFRSLPSLREVTLTWTRCPWDVDSEACRLFSADVSIRMAKREAFDIQDAVMRELFKAATGLDTLSLEPISMLGLNGELYPGGEPELGTCCRADEHLAIAEAPSRFDFFMALRRLSLVLDRKSESSMEAGLRAVLRQTKLKELRLEYLPWVRVRPRTSFLEGVYISELEVLEVIGPEVGLRNLAVFLARHGHTLKKLELVDVKGISCSEGTDSDSDGQSTKAEDVYVEPSAALHDINIAWTEANTLEGVFAMIAERLAKLEQVRVAGAFTDPVSGGKCWFYHDAIQVGPAVPEDVWLAPARPMEKYLLRQGEMPELKFWAEGT
ncbi:hypothetical protein E5D57_011641 [Metarhizium anisopliae]|nr:hypothetical protein E5D57_011641 [Metarhizium anisopliae]